MIRPLLCCSIGLSLVVLAAGEFYRSAAASDDADGVFLNGDTLYPAGFYEDIVVDGCSWRDWRFAGATAMYPDFLIYFAARAVTGSVASAMVVCSAVLFALLLLSCWLLIRTLSSPERRCLQTSILLSIGALFLLFNAKCGVHNAFLRLPLILTYHAGEQICLILDLALINFLIQSPSWHGRRRLAFAALWINTTLCIASDRLLIAHLIIPGVATILLYRLLLGGSQRGLSLQKMTLLLGCLIFASFSGKQLLRLMYPAWQDLLTHIPFSLKNASACFRIIFEKWREQLLAGEILHWSASMYLSLSLAFVVYAAIRRTASGTLETFGDIQRRLLFVALSYLGMSAAILMAVCCTTRFYAPPEVSDVEWRGAARYFIPVLVMPYFLMGTWLGLLPRRIACFVFWVAAIGLTAFSIGYYRMTAEIPQDPRRDLWNYYPPEVRRLDAIAEKYDLRYGLGGFTDARRYTLFSRKGLRVHPITAEPENSWLMKPCVWMNNSHSYFNTAESVSAHRYRFILVDERIGNWTPKASDIIARYGTPAEAVDCGSTQIFIYGRVGDAEFQEIAERDCHFIRERFRFQKGETVRFPADSLPSPLWGVSAPHDRTAREGSVPAGVLSAGPLLCFREPGTYRVTLAGACSAEMEKTAEWQLSVLGHKGIPSFEARRAIAHESAALSSIEVAIRKKQLGEALECRVHYFGKGTLTLHYLEVERIE